MFTTLADAKASGLRKIAGVCANSSDFIQLLNDATRRLLNRGDFVDTVIRIQVCAYSGCVVFPRYVGQIRKVNLSTGPFPVHNLWWDFFRARGSSGCSGAACGLTYMGPTPVFDGPRGEARTIRAYPVCQADVGKTIRIFGTDNYGQTLKTKVNNTTWEDGIELTLAIPYVSTSTFVRHVDRVVKDDTECVVRLYGYDSVNDVLEDMAYYEPSETNPRYERYQLTSCCGDCSSARAIVALVKLAFVPVSGDNDLVLIRNLDALKLMMQAIRFEEANDRDSARAYEADAIRELNLELSNQTPDDRIPVNLGELNNTDWIGHQRCY